MRSVSVIGLGYLGVIQAIVLAESGHSVVAVDTDEGRIKTLSAGVAPFFEPELHERLAKVVELGNIRFVSDFGSWVQAVEIHFLCVGTPYSKDLGSIDDTSLFQVADEISADLRAGALVVGRSTVEVGTAQRLHEHLESKSVSPIRLAWNPEFLSEGTAFRDSFNPERVVIGSNDERALAMLVDLYSDPIYNNAPIVSMDLASAEIVKAAANSFLALKISFINGLSGMAGKAGANITKISHALGLDTRIGTKYLKSGLGFGGGCLPKDTLGFAQTAVILEQETFSRLLMTVLEINAEQVSASLSTVRDLIGDLSGKKICVLGATFKPNTDDIRSSQSLLLVSALLESGAKVSLHDPIGLSKVGLQHQNLYKEKEIGQAFSDADIVVLATEWDDYLDVDPRAYVTSVRRPLILDLRGSLSQETWVKHGWEFARLGEHSNPKDVTANQPNSERT